MPGRYFQSTSERLRGSKGSAPSHCDIDFSCRHQSLCATHLYSHTFQLPGCTLLPSSSLDNQYMHEYPVFLPITSLSRLCMMNVSNSRSLLRDSSRPLVLGSQAPRRLGQSVDFAGVASLETLSHSPSFGIFDIVIVAFLPPCIFSSLYFFFQSPQRQYWTSHVLSLECIIATAACQLAPSPRS